MPGSRDVQEYTGWAASALKRAISTHIERRLAAIIRADALTTECPGATMKTWFHRITHSLTLLQVLQLSRGNLGFVEVEVVLADGIVD